MKTPLRTLTCALAARERRRRRARRPRTPASSACTAGPGRARRSARRRADDALAGRQQPRPGPARLRPARRDDARRARWPLVQRQTAVLARPLRRRALALPGRRARRADAARAARRGSRSTRSRPTAVGVYLTRRASADGRDEVHGARTYRAQTRSSTPVVTKVDVLRRRAPSSPTAGRCRACRSPAARRRAAVGVHALQLARVPVHPRAAGRAGRVGGLHRAARVVARPRRQPAPAGRRGDDRRRAERPRRGHRLRGRPVGEAHPPRPDRSRVAYRTARSGPRPAARAVRCR